MFYFSLLNFKICWEFLIANLVFKKPATVGANMMNENLDYSKLENPLYVDDHNEPIKDFSFLDWGRLQNWKFNDKQHISPRFNNHSTLVESRSLRVSRTKKQMQQTPNGSPFISPSKQIHHHMMELDDQMTPDVDDHHSCPLPLPLSETSFGGRSLEDNIKIFKKHDLNDVKLLSPNRRFNFSFGKMGRSHSLKETSNQESLDSLNGNWKKSNAANSSRSSPLRRFLDPLLKPKGPHLADRVVHKSKLVPNPNPSFVRVKHKSSSVQALVQLTLKDGIPFFKLVVESSSDLLAAAVKKLPSGKGDASLIYALYSVRETKKKSGGWIYPSSKEKEKGYCFEYNIVGQMKITSSFHAELNGQENGLCFVRESVLYSTETSQTACADHKTVDCTLEGELAAIIVKNPCDETCGGIGRSETTTVVLPDCVHGIPNSGSPSPLIDRWRSGGACDCGGWDIGCQFHVLSNHQNKMFKTSTTQSASNHLDLCYQVGHKNKCCFRLVSVEDGLYSLEYDASMSLLQAFSICVAVVTSQKLTHIFDVTHVLESNGLCKLIPTVNEKVKSRVLEPPASPVARV
ncbi:hypothetical protein QVD17_40299 [Tagetes erecta]|uniref:Uncharacterized protein n=1 Tax=Tagetes erecta TaxID=13708 RepID=A0AAD8NHT8_TARER|nr:hypothetical protein QVD17_40299 [Tagetes erecta]